jgi:pyruvate-formate lyase-activating enzyme
MRFSALVRRAVFGMRYALRMRRGRRAVTRHLRAPEETSVPMPTFVQLRVTNLCNLRCKMCGQWGDTGIFRDRSDGHATDGGREAAAVRERIGHNRQLSLADYERLLDEIAPFEPVVTLFGGEPLLHPQIVPLVRSIKRRSLTVTMITNGWRLEECARDLVAAGIDAVAVSVDGTPAVHDRIRGREGSFGRLAAGVEALSRARCEEGRAIPVILAILPITELNMEAIGPAIAALGEFPLDVINVGLRWFVPPTEGARYEKVMASRFGVSGDSWKGFEFSWPGGVAPASSTLSVDGRGSPSSPISCRRTCPRISRSPPGRSVTTCVPWPGTSRRWSLTETCASAATSRTT